MLGNIGRYLLLFYYNGFVKLALIAIPICVVWIPGFIEYVEKEKETSPYISYAVEECVKENSSMEEDDGFIVIKCQKESETE